MIASENEISKSTVISNLLEIFRANQVVSFIVSIVLAWLLMPEEFGMIAMVTVFIVIADALDAHNNKMSEIIFGA